jgi:7,8-dihydroneopterin aldolase/epimerase/oxygenase
MRNVLRPVLTNVGNFTNTRAAGARDELADTIDYSLAIERIHKIVAAGEWRLIEHLAEEVARLLLQECGAQSVNVEIIKESPPVDEDVKAVSVTIERSSR